jgi:hypothetical protein
MGCDSRERGLFRLWRIHIEGCKSSRFREKLDRGVDEDGGWRERVAAPIIVQARQRNGKKKLMERRRAALSRNKLVWRGAQGQHVLCVRF